MGRLTKRKCYRPPKRASWTLELSLPQINLFKVVLKSLKLLMESRSCLPSPRTLPVPCRWPLQIWNNSTQESVPRDLVTCFVEANRIFSWSHMSAARVLLLLLQRLKSSKSVRFSLYLQFQRNGNDHDTTIHLEKVTKKVTNTDRRTCQEFSKKDTAPGIPRRSPIQVLTRPAVV